MPSKLAHDSVNEVLLHVDVEDKWLPREPVHGVSYVQRGQTQCCTLIDSLHRVWTPPKVIVPKSVQLHDVLQVRPVNRHVCLTPAPHVPHCRAILVNVPIHPVTIRGRVHQRTADGEPLVRPKLECSGHPVKRVCGSPLCMHCISLGTSR
uniref:Uncharacterized protein n=1 Tax=Arundo donax TaxID=35708 RepID=A0A0A9CVM5_ARUDO